LPRLSRDGVNGILVPPNDVAALSEALMDVLRDPHGRAKLRRAGRRTVHEQYSFERRIRRLQTIYDELLGSKTGRRSFLPSGDSVGKLRPDRAETSCVPFSSSPQRGAS